MSSTSADFTLTSITTMQDVPENDYAKHGLSKEKLRMMLQKMLLIRRFEEKIEELFLVKGALIGPSHLQLGEEAIAVGAITALKPNDLTVVGVSRMVGEAMSAAKKLEETGVSAEVVDIRTLQPLDLETIVNSVKRTSRLVVASDDVKTGGVGSEISAAVLESAFDYLDAPIVRVACPEMPVPFSPALEQMYMPSANKIVQAVSQIMG